MTLRAGDIVGKYNQQSTCDVLPREFYNKFGWHRQAVIKQLREILETVKDADLYAKLMHKCNVFMSEARVYDMGKDLMIPASKSSMVVGEDYEDELLRKPGNILLEGAQGVLLDEWYGFHPHTTWSTTTFHNAEMFLARYAGKVVKIGVTRAYHTRHGAGPFPSHDATMTTNLPDAENVHNKWQGNFRVGALDLTLLRYAVNLVQPDIISLTCIDRLSSNVTLASHRVTLPNRSLEKTLDESKAIHNHLSTITSDEIFLSTVLTSSLPYQIEKATGIAVGMISAGTKADDKTYNDTRCKVWNDALQQLG